MARRTTIDYKNMPKDQQLAYARVANAKSRAKKQSGSHKRHLKENEPKQCTTCGRVFPATEEFFYSTRTSEKGRRYLNTRCKSCIHTYQIARKFKLDEKRLGELRKGFCDICWGKGTMCVDHNHTTGFIRGILCRNCNTGLGHFKDSIRILRRAIEYLEDRQ